MRLRDIIGDVIGAVSLFATLYLLLFMTMLEPESRTNSEQTIITETK